MQVMNTPQSKVPVPCFSMLAWIHLHPSGASGVPDRRFCSMPRWTETYQEVSVRKFHAKPTNICTCCTNRKSFHWHAFCFVSGSPDFGSISFQLFWLGPFPADKIRTASCTYIHVLSLCHLYPLPVTWRIQMRTFKRYFSRAVLLTTLHLTCRTRTSHLWEDCS
jgi:hypothetical protein